MERNKRRRNLLQCLLLELSICMMTDFRNWMPPLIGECVVVGGSGNPEMKESGDMTNSRK
jgi:hypothetical protein